MRISDEARQQVRPRDFYLAVFAVTLLLTGMGLWFMKTGTVPAIPRVAWALALGIIWAITLFRCRRGGVTAIQGSQWVLLIGWTLFGISHLTPTATWLPSWLEPLGVVLMVASTLLRVIHFGGPQQSAGTH